MSNFTINTEIFFNDEKDMQISSGYLIVKTSETINIDSINGSIYFEARGRMSSRKEKVLSFNILDQKKIIKKNETYNFPFSFKLLDNYIDSYKGKNVSFSYNLETSINIDENDYKKLEMGFLSNLVSFLRVDKSIKTSKYYKVEDPLKKYQITEAKSTLNIQANLLISLLIAIIFGSAFAYLIPEFNIFNIISGIVLIILIIYLVTKSIGNTLGIVTMKTLRDEEAFLCIIKKTRNFNLSNQSIYYEIIEKVVDNRGTSSSTYHEIIYTSDKKKLPDFKSSQKLKFDYPQNKGLQSTEFKDASIIWEMNLEGSTYFGFIIKYKSTFVVKKY